MVKCAPYDAALHRNVLVHYNPTALAHAHLVEKVFKTDDSAEAKEEKRRLKEERKKRVADKIAAKQRKHTPPGAKQRPDAGQK